MINKRTKEVFFITIVLFLIAFLFGTVFQNIYGYSTKIAQVSYYSILIFIIVFTVKKYEGKRMNSIGLYTNNLMKQILIGIVTFGGVSLFTIIPLVMGVDKKELLAFKPENVAILIFFIFYDICFVGFGEELIFRGYFLEQINKIFNSKIWAVLISSILFGLWHYPTNHNIQQVIAATVLGMIFSICKLKIKNCGLISLAIAHGLNDAFIILLGYFFL